MKFISTTYLESIGLMFNVFDDSASSSGTQNRETCNIQCDKENENSYIIINQTHKWNEKETKYLLDQYCLYFPQIGLFRVFKNKAAIFEQISKDLYQQFNIRVTGPQYSNKYKNVSRQHKNALSGNKVSGHAPTEVPYGSEFEKN
ncbi:uncharacterized protein LOC112466370 [Temnothorax curvispinosus]|uniref:Uncharacterized protein LOC112466370 n=1 Tax=Temnothorax curvispinosus TaxID=300111 RepID=A0A6J1R7L8_9HYME|nr:uncharacterized protein LOC112466370 [Temnothorax curvispinosus]